MPPAGKDLTKSTVLTVYHASTGVVEQPAWDYTKDGEQQPAKDFGQGFYMCESPDYPVELYCENDVVILNQYTLDLSALDVLALNDDTYWALAVAAHRRNFTDYPEWHPLRDDIRARLARYDIITGTISNDRMFATMDNFFDDLCTDRFVLDALRVMRYPLQYVSKSNKADSHIRYVGHQAIPLDDLINTRERKLRERGQMITAVRRMRAARHSTEGQRFSMIVEEWSKHGGI